MVADCARASDEQYPALW